MNGRNYFSTEGQSSNLSQKNTNGLGVTEVTDLVRNQNRRKTNKILDGTDGIDCVDEERSVSERLDDFNEMTSGWD